MSRIRLFVFALAGMLLSPPAQAALNVFACEPEWAALAEEIGAGALKTFAATTANQDPHRIEARPSLIARVRQADLVVCTGAELESGWLPLLLRQAGNAKVQPGQPSYFEAAAVVERLDVPQSVDRAMGDVHPSGNPHVHTDPRRLAIIAERLTDRLIKLDSANAEKYRAAHLSFAARWHKAVGEWRERAQPLKGMRVVAHHDDWIYLFDWLGIVDAGTLEPKPGIPSSAAHLSNLKSQLAAQPARAVVRTPYQDPRPGKWLSEQTGIPVVVLPYTVGGSPRARDLFGLFADTIDRLLEARR